MFNRAHGHGCEHCQPIYTNFGIVSKTLFACGLH